MEQHFWYILWTYVFGLFVMGTLFRSYTKSTSKEIKQLKEDFEKNYNFNNCNVTIYEEGKAIELLQEQEKRKAKMQEAQMKLVESVVEIAGKTINTMIESKTKKAMESEIADEPVSTDPKTTTRKKATAKKKAPAKKVVKKK